MAQFPSAVATDSDLYIAVNLLSTTITDNPLSAGATTVNVVSTTLWPTVGAISIDAEIIHYTGKTGTSFTGCTRGFDGSTATSHAVNTAGYHYIIAAHHNVLKDEIKAIEQHLFDKIGLSVTQNVFPAGSVTSPSLTFSSDLDTGLYSVGANLIGFASNGTYIMRVDAGGIEMQLGSIRNVVGSAADPSYTFWADIDTGMYQVAANQLGFSAGGVLRATIDSTGIVLNSLKISGLAAASGNGEAVRYEQLVGAYLSLSGGTLSGALLHANGTISAPSVSFSSDTNTGIYWNSADKFSIVTNGSDRMTFDGAAINSWASFRVADGSVSVPSMSFINDTDTGLYLGSSGGAYLGLTVGGTLQFYAQNGLVMNTGVISNNAGTLASPSYTFWTNSDTGMYLNGSDVNFSINNSLALSVQSSYVFMYRTLMPNGAANYNQGDASNYWNEINYKTLTDRGCLPWCDDGVELADGTFVTDLEALCQIEKHPVEMTIQGLPKLNYATFPKKAYKPAEVAGELLPRDANDLPVGGADGVEMTVMFGVMIGAFKELKAKLDTLEQRIATLEA